MAAHEFIGRKVKIGLTDNTYYDGFVHSVDANLGKVTLEKVICTDEDGEKTKLVGLQNLFNHEITSIVAAEEVIKSRKKEGQGVSPRRNGERSIMKPKLTNKHLDRLEVFEPKSLILKHSSPRDGMTSSGNEETASSETEEDVISHPEYTVIGKLNSVFYDAIQYIKKHLVIAVAMEGVSVGRNGKLCWVQIAVPDHVIVFDVLKMGNYAFTEGLQSILEAESILKVFHDCRMVSDIMYHQYGINLVNVFDTQVASAFVYRLQHHNDWPRHVHGLASCLLEHLNLEESQVNWAVVREGLRESDEEVWMQRPARRKHLDALVKNVVHLLDLRQVLMEKMMEEYVAGVNIYLTHVRDASNGDIQKYQRMSHLLPSSFQDIKHFMRSYTGRNPFNRPEWSATDINGFRDNFSRMKHPNVIFSHDSLWHAGSKVQESKTAEEKEQEPKKLQKYGSQLSNLITNSEKMEQETNSEKGGQKSDTGIPHDKVLYFSKEHTNVPLESNYDQLREATDLVNRVEHSEIQILSTHQDVNTGSSNNQSITGNQSMTFNQSITGNQSMTFNQSITKLHDLIKQPQENQNRNIEGLTGGSLMRALINQQAPPGTEVHSDLDNMMVTPAGKAIERNIKKKSVPSIPQMCNNVSRPGMKRLTEKEMELVNKFGRQTERVSEAGQNDTILAPSRRSPSNLGNRMSINVENSVKNNENEFKYLPLQSSKSPEGLSQRSDTQSVQHSSQHSAFHSEGSSQYQSGVKSPSAQSTGLSPTEVHVTEMNTSPVSGRLQALMRAMNT